MAKRMQITGMRRRDLFEQLETAAASTVAPRFTLARLWQAVWGMPQTVVGATMFWLLRRTNRWTRFRSAYVMEWALDAGLSMGLFIFLPRGSARSLLVHEYGHTIQSLMLGPLYLLVVVLPSLAWAGLPRMQRFRDARQVSYYRFYTERWANKLARKVTGETPIGWY